MNIQHSFYDQFQSDSSSGGGEEDIQEDLIQLQLESVNIKINYFQLCKYSQLIRDKYLISDVKNKLPADLQQFIKENKVQPENVDNYFKSLQSDNLEVTSSRFLDFHKLSDFLNVKRFKTQLKKFVKSHRDDPDFIIQTILDQPKLKSDTNSNELQMTVQIQENLSANVSSCLQNEKFEKLPISMVYNIVEKSNTEQLSSDILFSFIKKAIDSNYPLLNFLELGKLSNENFENLYQLFMNSKGSQKSHYFNFLPCNLDYIKSLKENNEQIKKRADDLEKQNIQLLEKLKQLQPIKLHIKICEARNVLKMDLGGKSDPFVALRLKSQDKKECQKTQVISNTLNPIWNQEFDIIAAYPDDVLLINMYDIKNYDKMMDELQFPINTWPVGCPLDKKELNIKLKKKKEAGTFIFEVQSEYA